MNEYIAGEELKIGDPVWVDTRRKVWKLKPEPVVCEHEWDGLFICSKCGADNLGKFPKPSPLPPLPSCFEKGEMGPVGTANRINALITWASAVEERLKEVKAWNGKS
jgi:hypothetical protein